MDYFGLDDEIASLERQLREPQGRANVAAMVRLAWYLRRRDTRRAVHLADEASSLASSGDSSLSARLTLVHAECLWLFGELGEAEAALEVAKSRFLSAGDQVGLGDCALLQAPLNHDMGRPERCADAFATAYPAFASAGDTTRLMLAQARAVFYESYRDLDSATARWQGLSEQAHAHPHPGLQAAAHNADGSLMFETDAGAALRSYQLGYECSLAAGDLYTACVQASNVAAGLQNMHVYDLALEWMERSHDIALPTGWVRALAWAKVQMALVLSKIGHHALARSLLHEGRAALAKYPGRAYAHACWYLGQLCLRTGEHEDALDLMAETEQLGKQLGNFDMVLHGIRGQAEALSLAYRPEEARATAERGLAQARSTDCAWQEKLALEALAKICKAHKQPLPAGSQAPNAVAHYLEQAIAAAQRTNGYGVTPEVYADLSREYEAAKDWQRALAYERMATEAQNASHAKRAADLALVTQLRHDRDRLRVQATHRKALTDGDNPRGLELHAAAAEAPVAPTADAEADGLLRTARLALDAGDAPGARESAQEALQSARAHGNLHAEARALSLIARIDRASSHLRVAVETASRAVHLFQRLGDVVGEANALATVSIACSCLGHNEDALEAALLCNRLAESLPAGRQRVLALVHLGIACAWARRFDEAAAAFAESARIASTSSPRMSSTQPRLHHALGEALRVLVTWCTTGEVPALRRLNDSLDACAPLIQAAQAQPEGRPPRPSTLCAWHLILGARHCWEGRPEAGAAALDEVCRLLVACGPRTPLEVLAAWLRTEVALARGDLPAAEAHAAAWVATAQQLEHEQMAMLGRMAIARLLERQGRHGQALRELHGLLEHEHQVRAAAFEGRREVVRWQIELRDHKALAELETRRAQTLEAANDTLRTLGTIGNEITATLDPSAMFAALNRHAGELLDAASVSIYLLEGQHLVLRFGEEDGRPVPSFGIPLDDPRSQAARCVRERRTLALELSAEPDAQVIAGTRPMPSALFGPLVAGDRVLGALSIQSAREGAYGERERQLFRTLAAYGSVAIANALSAQDLAAAQAELERQRMQNLVVHAGKLASMGRLASGIVHEISHPVGAISLSLGSMRTLLQTGQAQEAENLVPEVEHEVTRLHMLIRRLRHMARSDPPRITDISLQSAVDEARRMFGPRLATASVDYREEDLKGHDVKADIELLSLAITNLVVNAIDALADRDPKRIVIRARPADEGWVQLTITDTGPGLPPEILDHLFKPFLTTKPEDQGTGLGLALCAEYLAAMGAQIRGANRPGNGAEFTLTLRAAA